MKISKQAKVEARRLFRECSVNGRFDENRARQVVTLLADQQPRGFLPILTQFQKLLKMDDERRTAIIESASSMTPDYQAKVQGDLTKIYGNDLKFVYKQNSVLLGGLRIKVGGDVYDGSVQGRLEALQESI